MADNMPKPAAPVNVKAALRVLNERIKQEAATEAQGTPGEQGEQSAAASATDDSETDSQIGDLEAIHSELMRALHRARA